MWIFVIKCYVYVNFHKKYLIFIEKSQHNIFMSVFFTKYLTCNVMYKTKKTLIRSFISIDVYLYGILL
jgi:hypothetical protein